MTRISEKRDVQDALVNYLVGIGWIYLPSEARGGDEAQLREAVVLPASATRIATR